MSNLREDQPSVAAGTEMNADSAGIGPIRMARGKSPEEIIQELAGDHFQMEKLGLLPDRTQPR